MRVDFNLTPGLVTQTVEITSAVPLLQTQSSTVGQTIDEHQVNDLPLNGRNYTFLAQIAAGVVGMAGGRVQGTGGFTANGLPWSHNSYILDGMDNNNDTVDFNSGTAYVVLTPPDAIQEVSIQTSNFTAEYGRAGSAVINAPPSPVRISCGGACESTFAITNWTHLLGAPIAPEQPSRSSGRISLGLQ